MIQCETFIQQTFLAASSSILNEEIFLHRLQDIYRIAVNLVFTLYPGCKPQIPHNLVDMRMFCGGKKKISNKILARIDCHINVAHQTEKHSERAKSELFFFIQSIYICRYCLFVPSIHNTSIFLVTVTGQCATLLILLCCTINLIQPAFIKQLSSLSRYTCQKKKKIYFLSISNTECTLYCRIKYSTHSTWVVYCFKRICSFMYSINARNWHIVHCIHTAKCFLFICFSYYLFHSGPPVEFWLKQYSTAKFQQVQYQVVKTYFSHEFNQ